MLLPYFCRIFARLGPGSAFAAKTDQEQIAYLQSILDKLDEDGMTGGEVLEMAGNSEQSQFTIQMQAMMTQQQMQATCCV